MRIDVTHTERAFLLLDGKPVRYLAPGRHRVFAPFQAARVERVSVTGLIADLDDTRLALVPPQDLAVVTLAPRERAVVWKKGRPALWLSAGAHQVWTVDRQVERAAKAVTPLVRVEVHDTSGIQAPLFSADVAKVVTGRDWVEAAAPSGSVVLRFVDGTLDAVLPAGRHAAWNILRAVMLSVIDLRERLLNVAGQEVMPRDRVSLRLTISATFTVTDAERLATVASAPDELVYLAMQLAARDAVMAKTLDELLAAREALAAEMAPVVKARAEAVGLGLVELGVKDVVLPGEMKALLNKVIEAQKEAEANVILRREETAATRSMAQTAKVLQENPLLVRLKELEAYAELAGKVGTLNLVMGDGKLPALKLEM